MFRKYWNKIRGEGSLFNFPLLQKSFWLSWGCRAKAAHKRGAWQIQEIRRSWEPVWRLSRHALPAARLECLRAGKWWIYNVFFQGGLAIAVPGEVHGQYKAWKEYGRLPWEALVQPAINLAREGFEISTAVADALKEMVEKIKTDPGLR